MVKYVICFSRTRYRLKEIPGWQAGTESALRKGKLMGKQGGTVLTLKNDVIFKAVYGRDTEECKFVLMALLNHILGREQDPIVSLEYKNPFHMRQRADEKESVLDIKVETGSGELIDIEMQICSYDDLINRLIYYHGGLIRESLKKGEAYGKMLKTITICIVDDIVFSETGKFLNVFSLMEETTHIPFSNMTGICVIELPKVNPDKRPPQKLSQLECSLEYLKHADEVGSEKQEELIRFGGKELEMTQQLLKKATEEEILREKALAREKYLHDKAHFKYLQKEAKKRQQEMEMWLKEKESQLEEKESQLVEAESQLEEKKSQLKESEEKLEETKKQLDASKEKQHALNQELEKVTQELEAMKEKYRDR